MKWGVRHDPERTGRQPSGSRKKMSTAKKVAIGVAVAAAVGGVSYVAITRKNNKAASAARQKALRVMRKYSSTKIKRGPSGANFSPGDNGLVSVTKKTRKLTGHSGRVTAAGAAKHRVNFYNERARKAPLSYDYMTGNTTRGAYERKSYDAGQELVDIYKKKSDVKLYNRGKINKLRRQKGPKALRYKR